MPCKFIKLINTLFLKTLNIFDIKKQFEQQKTLKVQTKKHILLRNNPIKLKTGEISSCLHEKQIFKLYTLILWRAWPKVVRKPQKFTINFNKSVEMNF